ncbi:MAG: hydroxylamine reductase [bacterium]|nr:hydroxylamine reductase [bacterium]
MSMFCNQCQEAAKGTGCEGTRGVCGITEAVINLQDVAVYTLKGIAIYSTKARELGVENDKVNRFFVDVLFKTITNANFSRVHAMEFIQEGLELREVIKKALLDKGGKLPDNLPDCAVWTGSTEEDFIKKAAEIGSKIDAPNEDVRSLRALVLYGLKGAAAYIEHSFNLGYENNEIYAFMQKAVAALTDDSMSADELTALVLETGKCGVDCMAMLDKANTETYGNPELTQVNIGTGSNPGILISGHDLKDMEELLKQTENSGVDVYTHSEMLAANSYPELKKYKHFVGNYGNAWWKQAAEFETFKGPVLFTSNCLIPPKDSYKDRIYTTGAVGFDGVAHIPDREKGKMKDFSAIIEHAKKCSPPEAIESGSITAGFAHNQVLALADKVVEAVKSGAVKKFVVMAGCDGRMKSRSYYTEFAEAMPKDSIILTAGCAKFRYNKLDMGDIGGIPRVLDAGQCNDSYSLVVIAMKLQEVFELDDINKLPIAYNIAWYEQKAVIVLLALLHLGVKNIHLGPTLPAFLSENITKVLVENFNIGGIASVEDDIKMFFS